MIQIAVIGAGNWGRNLVRVCQDVASVSAYGPGSNMLHRRIWRRLLPGVERRTNGYLKRTFKNCFEGAAATCGLFFSMNSQILMPTRCLSLGQNGATEV